MTRRGMQPAKAGQQNTSEEEGEPQIDHKNFMAFDCNIANPLTKKAMNTKMHIDSMANKCIISHPMAEELGLEVLPSEYQRAKLANGAPHLWTCLLCHARSRSEGKRRCTSNR